MKRTYRFIEPWGMVACNVDGEELLMPVFGGILKHPTEEQLAALLADPLVLRKYTMVALLKAPWNALRRFPRSWLLTCLSDAKLPEGRRKAVELLLGVADASPVSELRGIATKS